MCSMIFIGHQRKRIIKELSSTYKRVFIFCKPKAGLFIVFAFVNDSIVLKRITNQH